MRATHASALVLAGGLLAGCGSSTSSGGASSATGTQTIRVGTGPTVDAVALHLGIDKGFFKDAGMNVQTQVIQDGASVTSSVIGGTLDIGLAAPTPTITAVSKGLPLQFIAPNNSYGPSAARDSGGLLALTSSPIKSIAELRGRTVAVNALGSQQDLLLRVALGKAGVDPGTVTFLEVPFPTMAAAVTGRKVDAAYTFEPFLSQATANGLAEVADPGADQAPGATLTAFYSSKSYIAKHGDLVKSFATAMQKSNSYAQANPQEYLNEAATFTKVPATTLATIKLPQFGGGSLSDGLRPIVTYMQQVGFIAKPINVADLVATGIGK